MIYLGVETKLKKIMKFEIFMKFKNFMENQVLQWNFEWNYVFYRFARPCPTGAELRVFIMLVAQGV